MVIGRLYPLDSLLFLLFLDGVCIVIAVAALFLFVCVEEWRCRLQELGEGRARAAAAVEL